MVDTVLISSYLRSLVERLRLAMLQGDREGASFAPFVRLGPHPRTVLPDDDEAFTLAFVPPSSEVSTNSFVIANTDCFQALVNSVCSDILDGASVNFKTRSILSSTNATIRKINAHVLNVLPGDLLAACS